jgi:signal transduction histidine kinase
MIRALDTLIGRTILVSLIGISLMHILSLWSYEAALQREQMLAHEKQLSDRLLNIRRSLALAPELGRDDLAHQLSGGPLDVHWSRSVHAVAGGAGAEPRWSSLVDRLRRLEPALASADVVVGPPGLETADPHVTLVSVRLPDASWANVSLLDSARPHSGGHGTLLSTTVMALGVVALSVVIAGWLTRPIRYVAKAVRALRPGEIAARISEQGPREVRDLAIAFNDMQARIARLIEERTRALAAVSHDLRTPLTRLKLRLEDLGRTETTAAMAADLAELEQMIDATLSYLKGESEDEPPRAIDLAALLRTLADESSDLGQDVSLSGPQSLVIRGHRLALKRAFSNLIQNAVKYGSRARIRIESSPEVMVHIDDDGPGIPPDKLGAVLEPFVRLETSRNRDTGGVGLGLTIARAKIEADGGRLTLANRDEAGLRATVTLPARSRR